MILRAVHHPDVERHAPKDFFKRGQMVPTPEIPARARAAFDLLSRRGVPLTLAPDAGPAPRAAVHTPALLRYLETAHTRWTAKPGFSDIVIPNVFQGPGMTGYPADILGQAGFHTSDLSAPIVAETWSAITAAANVAVHAARQVMQGDAHASYAICRPPGHHASRERIGGFCYLNNAAIAAQDALVQLAAQGKPPRAAILDIDLHHGNGTQDIFYEREDVLFVSLHADSAWTYPYLSGYRGETGAGRGLGYTLNYPLPVGTPDAGYQEALADALSSIRAFAPGILVLSLGFDPFEGDPYQGLKVTTPGFGRIGEMIAALGLPTAIVQEGGYAVDDLQANLSSFLDGFEGACSTL